MADEYCDQLSSPNIWVLSLSVFLVAGILGSYLPQHWKIISHGSSAGLSPWWVLLGTLSSIAGLANIVVLPGSQHDMQCCKEISASACTAAMLGVVQVGVQWLCFTIIMVLFIFYFPGSIERTMREAMGEDSAKTLPKPHDRWVVLSASLIAIVGAIAGSAFFLLVKPEYVLSWANMLGLAASGLACIQYLPQIFTTYRLGRIMSLSIITMLIQVPGSFLFSFSLYLRVGLQGWSTWLVYCVTGILQGVLLTMAIRFWYTNKWAEEEEESRVAARIERRFSSGHTERTPLLGRDDSSRPPNSSTLRTIGGKPKKHSLDLLYSASPRSINSLPSESDSQSPPQDR